MPAKCCVPNCTTRKGIRCHLLPHDKSRRLQWLEAVNREDLIHKDYDKIKGIYRVCTLHFSMKQKFIDLGNRSNLKHTAVPDINLPKIKKTDDSQITVLNLKNKLNTSNTSSVYHIENGNVVEAKTAGLRIEKQLMTPKKNLVYLKTSRSVCNKRNINVKKQKIFKISDLAKDGVVLNNYKKNVQLIGFKTIKNTTLSSKNIDTVQKVNKGSCEQDNIGFLELNEFKSGKECILKNQIKECYYKNIVIKGKNNKFIKLVNTGPNEQNKFDIIEGCNIKNVDKEGRNVMQNDFNNDSEEKECYEDKKNVNDNLNHENKVVNDLSNSIRKRIVGIKKFNNKTIFQQNEINKIKRNWKEFVNLQVESIKTPDLDVNNPLTILNSSQSANTSCDEADEKSTHNESDETNINSEAGSENSDEEDISKIEKYVSEILKEKKTQKDNYCENNSMEEFGTDKNTIVSRKRGFYNEKHVNSDCSNVIAKRFKCGLNDANIQAKQKSPYIKPTNKQSSENAVAMKIKSNISMKLKALLNDEKTKAISINTHSNDDMILMDEDISDENEIVINTKSETNEKETKSIFNIGNLKYRGQNSVNDCNTKESNPYFIDKNTRILQKPGLSKEKSSTDENMMKKQFISDSDNDNNNKNVSSDKDKISKLINSCCKIKITTLKRKHSLDDKLK